MQDSVREIVEDMQRCVEDLENGSTDFDTLGLLEYYIGRLKVLEIQALKATV